MRRVVPSAVLVSGSVLAVCGVLASCAAPAVESDAGAIDAGVIDAGVIDAGVSDAGDAARGEIAVLVLTRTTGFRHASIEPALAALGEVQGAHGLRLERTEDAARLGDLAGVDVVVFLSTTGDVLGPKEEAELERFVRAGGGWVGVHSASDTEYEWPFYGELVGAWFDRHPAVQPAQIRVEDAAHPSVAHLPGSFSFEDEYYDFRTHPRGTVSVVLTVDESTYTGGTMGADHPIAWHRGIDRGRAFYTALGHPEGAWSDARLVEHVARAIVWAAGR